MGMLEYKRHYTLADFRGTGTIEKVTAVLAGEFESWEILDSRISHFAELGPSALSRD